MLPQSAADHYVDQQRLTVAVLQEVRRVWRRMSQGDFDASWAVLGPQITALVVAGQATAAEAANRYVPAVLAETDQLAPADAEVRTAGVAGVASDGRPLESLLYGPVITAKAAVERGSSPFQALQTVAWRALAMRVQTQLADADRVTAGVATAVRPRVSGYVRMLNAPSCSRCAVLAGRHYRWSKGFQRHPLCDCRMIPSSESVGQHMTTDPHAYFEHLTTQQQDATFTQAGAQAIRDGADVGQVVNVRRGAAGLDTAAGQLQRRDVYGQQLFTSTEGVTNRGIAGKALRGEQGTQKLPGARYRSAKVPRLMPESIYEIAEDRDDAIRLLRRYGFVL